MKPTCPKCGSRDIILSFDQSYGKCRYCDYIFEIKLPRRILNEEEIRSLTTRKDQAIESRKSVEAMIDNYSRTTSLPGAGEVIGKMITAAIIWFIISAILMLFGLEVAMEVVTICGIVFEIGCAGYLIYWIFAYPTAKYNLHKYGNIRNQLNTEISELSSKISSLSR